mgnify:CR=1 FL=1
MTDRATVDKADTMKVTTCLNPLHTALAIMGCLLGYRSIAEEMKDPDLSLLVSEIGYNEGLPVVESPGIIDPKTFLEEVVTVRFSNPNIPDMPQRIATDTSQKVAIRYGETIKKYMEIENKDPQTLVFIPLILAAWLRYLIGLMIKENHSHRVQILCWWNFSTGFLIFNWVRKIPHISKRKLFLFCQIKKFLV